MSWQSEHFAIYQKMSERGKTWVCRRHKRRANHILITPMGIRVVCDPRLGGIMLPCACTQDQHHTEKMEASAP